MAINIKRHFKIRYCQRILGIIDDKEIAHQLATQNEQLENHINLLWEHAEFIWKGQAGDNVTRHFYLTGDNIILVVDTDNTCLWTLYRAGWGFPENTNKTVIKDLMTAIHEANASLDGIGERTQELLDKTRAEKEKLARQSQTLQAQVAVLQAKIALLNSQMAALDEEVKIFYAEAKPLTLQRDEWAVQLVNSQALKRDMQTKDIKV